MEPQTSHPPTQHRNTSTSSNIEAFYKEYTDLCGRHNLVICLHCRKVRSPTSMKSRGLCKPCYENTSIRDGYDQVNKKSWFNGGRIWDIMDKAVLIDLLRSKLTDRQIAKQMNRTERAVGKARRRLGITRQKYTGKIHWPEELRPGTDN